MALMLDGDPSGTHFPLTALTPTLLRSDMPGMDLDLTSFAPDRAVIDFYWLGNLLRAQRVD